MGSANGLKSLNSGWQVWVNNAPASRNPSISSAASGPDPSQTEAGYRQNMAESWIAGSRNTGSWDDMSTNTQKIDSLSLPHVRQRQGHSGPIGAHSNGLSKANQLSPQRYEGGKDTSRYRGVSPSRVPSYGSATSSFSTQQPLLSTSPGANYDAVQTSSIVENDLSVALRGMAVEDEFSVSPQNYSQLSSGHASRPNPPATHDQSRNVQQSRTQYSGYPQADYPSYYTGQPSRIDYPYGYDAYRNPNDATLYANSPALSAATNAPHNVYPGMPQPLHHPLADLHAQQSGVFFDYSGSTRAPSQFYFHPNQPVLFPTPHPHSPMVSHSVADKKRDFQAQYNLQQQQMLFSNLRTSPSSQPYHAADYAGQIPILVAGPGMYAHAALGSHMLPYHAHGYHRGRREEMNGGYRSAKLEEFRTNKTKKWELREIYGHIVEFSSDQHGSRFIQQKLETATPEERQVIFDEIVPHNALRLIQDVFGNYVIQKLFEHGTQKQRTLLSSTMEGHILPLSLQMYGCRVVQKAIEHILPEQQGGFIKELESNVLRCVKDANGNHVIQRLIECVGAERLGFVQAFRGNVYDLSTHPYGCRVLQRCFEHLTEEHTRALLDELHKYSINLMQDQFGNYVIQFVLQHGQPQDRSLIISKLRGQMLNMARHKFASNVCEKALVTADSESRRLLIEEMMTPKQDGVNPIVTLMKDQYGNYVLQRALSVVEGDQKSVLVDMVRPQLVNMRKYSGSYSKHLTAIERLLESINAAPAPSGQQVATEEPKPSS